MNHRITGFAEASGTLALGGKKNENKYDECKHRKRKPEAHSAPACKDRLELKKGMERLNFKAFTLWSSL
jgi:hypothetical protein